MADPAVVDYVVSQQSAYLGYILAITRDRDAAEEILQNAVVAIMDHDSKDAIRDIPTWAKAVVRRQALLWLRRRIGERQQQAYRPDLLAGVLHAVDEDEPELADHQRSISALRACLDQAPERTRMMLVARVHDRASFEDIALRSGSSSAAVQRALSRLRLRLRQCIAQVLRNQPGSGAA